MTAPAAAWSAGAVTISSRGGARIVYQPRLPPVKLSRIGAAPSMCSLVSAL